MIYFDNAASTRMDERVLEASLPFMRECFGNANGKYSIGYEARHAINEARRQAASMIGAEPDEIYFTSGGTEGNNTIIKGFLDECPDTVFEQNGTEKTQYYECRTVISSEIEHDSVLNTIKYAAQRGAKVILLKTDHLSRIDPEKLLKLEIGGSRTMVSIMLVNNETGTIEPVKAFADIAHSRNYLIHTDAVQAAGHMKLDVKELGIDALSVSGHKLYGPKGTGFIYIRRGVKISPLVCGGGQERGMRSGTENVPGIVGLGKACELAKQELVERTRIESEISEYFKRRLLKSIPGSRLNGEGNWILNFSFEGINGTSLALRLDMEDICVSTGSACSAGLDERSHVLTAMGLSPEQTDSSIRISIGKDNTLEEARITCDCIERLVSELRSLTS